MESSKHEAPIYVKIDEYKEVLDMMDVIKGKLDKCHDLFDKLHELKQREDHELTEWKRGLDQVTHRVVAIDKSLFQPGE
ncbi:hypothetical protein CMO92_04935 [Candidatus Woesearchaeota archaeon]|nr:hypothetical protein [Candidatus Woesearchaeota archaeon]